MHYRTFSSIHGLYSLDASNTSHSVVTVKNIPKQNHLEFRTTSLGYGPVAQWLRSLEDKQVKEQSAERTERNTYEVIASAKNSDRLVLERVTGSRST